MSHSAPQVAEKTPNETRNVAVSFAGRLDGESLIGTPSLSVSPSGLSVSSAIVSESTLSINGRDVPASEAVQFVVSGGTADVVYTIAIVTTTESGQVLEGFVNICCVNS